MKETQPLDLEKLAKGKRWRVTMEETWNYIQRFDEGKEDRAWYLEIKGRYGTIYPFDDQELRVIVFTVQKCHKMAELLGKTARVKKGGEDIFSFRPERLGEVALIIKARKRGQKEELTLEQRGALADRLRRGREVHKTARQSTVQDARTGLESILIGNE